METLRSDPSDCGYSTFHVFGFDVMVDEDMRVWLIEVNSSPAVAEELLSDFADALVEDEIMPYFEDGKDEEAGRGETGDDDDGRDSGGGGGLSVTATLSPTSDRISGPMPTLPPPSAGSGGVSNDRQHDREHGGRWDIIFTPDSQRDGEKGGASVAGVDVP
uniref:Tubulin--tyrosine ligase n=1 Tax=Octactis speculum TaxID=3111310 RepID=A0A7S2F4N9_9STRA|mmetsp:Transcript_12538/g.16572  ORF Transcript_12538/g.16572 Transcript_12538/m.16572 type:complete len:161 (+) Transcript_12538:298-780(+)